MGTIWHEAVLVTGWDEKYVKPAWNIAVEIFGEQLVGPIIPSTTNHYLSFMVATSGSKLGWDDYNQHKANIQMFGERLKQANNLAAGYVDWVAVRYGADWEYKPAIIGGNGPTAGAEDR